jgi:hypothetical protein
MVNAWSLLFDELNMTNKSKYYYDYDRNDPNRKNPFKDSVNGSSNQDFWEYDGISLTGNPGTASSDTIVFGGSGLLGGMGDDSITFLSDGINAAESVPFNYFESEDTLSFDLPKPSNPPSNDGRRKYSEDVIIKELKDYITRTYDQHYSAGDDKIQTLDLIEACGDGEAFCRSNILKYASRYDKKGTARRDIMKILHYAVLLMHFNDKNAKLETYPQ